MQPVGGQLLSLGSDDPMFNVSPSSWLTAEFLQPGGDLPVLDSEIDLEELAENRSVGNAHHHYSPDSASTSPASDKSGVKGIELYDGCEVMATSELMVSKSVDEQEKYSVEQMQEGVQMASKLVRAREVYESSKNQWDDECMTVAKVVVVESSTGENQMPGSVDSPVLGRPGPGITSASIRMIISQGRATLVHDEISPDNSEGSSDSSEVEDSSESHESEDHKNMAGEDHEILTSVVDPVVDGVIKDMSERSEELECRTPEHQNVSEMASISVKRIDSPESPDNPFDRGDLDMVEMEHRENVSANEEQIESVVSVVVPERKTKGWTVTQGYCPMTSPISEVEPGDKVLKPSRIQRYWTRSQARKGVSGKKKQIRVARIRPTQFVNGRIVTVRQQYRPRQLHMGLVDPMLQANTVIARVIAADGTANDETMENRIFMTRATETQTRARLGLLSRSVVTQISIPGEAELRGAVEISSGEESEEGQSEPVILSDDTDNNDESDTEEDENEGEDGQSLGTPLQDE
jgi:hypothetical protein